MKICIVAGGTGGHIVPAIALAESVGDSEVFFITSRSRKVEQRFVDQIPGRKFFIEVKPITGKGLKAVEGIMSSFGALKSALSIIKSINPDVIIGFGGYVSGPVCLAGKILKKKVFIHEQNTVPGLANKILSVLSDGIFVSFKDTEFPRFVRRKIKYTGLPIREKFNKDLQLGIEQKNKEQKNGEVSIFISGGSQGAVGLNILFIEALRKIISSSRSIPRIRIFHQTGDLFYERAQKFYGDIGIEAEVFPFTERPGYYYGLCDFVVARGGAGTVFEVAIARKPAIFVPLPHSAGNHQFKNPISLLKDACFIAEQTNLNKFEVNLFQLLHKDIRDEIQRRMSDIQIPDAKEKIKFFLSSEVRI